MAERIGVLLVALPPLLRGLLEHAVTDNSRCELLTGETHPADRLMWRTQAPDVVVVGFGTTDDVALVPAILARWPLAHVVAVMAAGDGAVVYTLESHQQRLGDMSPDGIVEMLRDTVQRERDRERAQTER